MNVQLHVKLLSFLLRWLMDYYLVHSKLNGDSLSAHAEDNQEEEEDFLDPNSAFVSVAVSKNKRSCNAAAASHMDRSQRTSNTRKPVVSMCLNMSVIWTTANEPGALGNLQ